MWERKMLLLSEYSDWIVCNYVNATKQIQVLRIANISNWYFERVIFPRQCFQFEAPPDANLEIQTGIIASAILLDKVQCNRLRIS
jgi:Domain of unknown function (DUF1830)